MSSGQIPPTRLPSSYNDLKYQELKISHHPASSAEPTPVLICTLHRPGKNNAYTDTMTDEMEHFFALASIDDRVKCIVLTGHGKMFCAGQDLNQGFKLTGNGKEENDKNHRDGGGRSSLALHNCTKPTVVAINGHAVGVGITMTLPAAIRVAWAKAKIGFVFSQRGLIMEGCSSFFLPRLVGAARALQLCVTGNIYPATDKALDGLFTDLLERQEDVLPKALEYAEGIANNTSPVSTYMIRELIYRGADSAEAAHLLESRIMGHMRACPDNEEAVKSFLEKRKTVFTGTVQKDSPPVHPWYTPVNTKNGLWADPASYGKSKL